MSGARFSKEALQAGPCGGTREAQEALRPRSPLGQSRGHEGLEIPQPAPPLGS